MQQPGEEPELDTQQLIKLGIDMVPLILFGGTYYFFGLYPATGMLMAATVVAIIVSKVALGHVPVMPVVTAVLVVVFGGLTLYLQDARFIKMKPTVIYVLFSGILFAGLMLGKPLLKHLFGEVFNMTEEGWRRLTIRWGSFFLAMAVLNELVWRNYTEATWVTFKFALLPITMVFAVMQMGLVKRFAPPVSGETEERDS